MSLDTAKLEAFIREVPSRSTAGTARALLEGEKFENFDRAKCRDFMQEHGKTLLHVTTDVTKHSPKFRHLEKQLIEQGLLSGNYDCIPAIPSSFPKESLVAPYALTRLISSDRCEQLLILFDDEETLLTREGPRFSCHQEIDASWWIDKPCILTQNDGDKLSCYQRLSLSPERFLRYSLKIENHFNIEVVAREILNHTMNINCAGLALQYAGYPTEAEKSGAEAGKKKLLAEMGNTVHPKYEPKNLKTPESALPQSNDGVVSRMKSWAASWF